MFIQSHFESLQNTQPKCCLKNQHVFLITSKYAATSKACCRILEPVPEKSGPLKSWTMKTWILKNLKPEKPEPWRSCTLKKMDTEKHGSWKTWNKYGIKKMSDFRELCFIMELYYSYCSYCSSMVLKKPCAMWFVV